MIGSFRLFATAAALLTATTTLTAQSYPKGGDPRDGLKSGVADAGQAAKGMRLLATAPKPARKSAKG